MEIILEINYIEIFWKKKWKEWKRKKNYFQKNKIKKIKI